MLIWIVPPIILIWIYLLTVFKRARLDFWYFILGSIGFFTITVILLHPLLLLPMQRAIAAVAGLPGEWTGTYASYYEKGLLFVSHNATQLSLYIDFECTGILETLAFLSLLWFFPVYQLYEKIAVSVIGTATIFLANVLRIFVICQILYWGGERLYFTAHSFVGRFLFYAITIALYFYVFTRSQIVRQKVGAFSYEHHT